MKMRVEQFFGRVGREVFEACLMSLGARYFEEVSPTVVRFLADGWFVEMLVLLEEGPRYCPRVEIGPLPRLGLLPRQRQVDIKHTVPAGNELRNYILLWRYRDEDEMRAVYQRVRDEIFQPFAAPYLAQPTRLRELVYRRCEEVEREWEAKIAAHDEAISRTKADQAFRQANYAEYLAEMKEIPEARWSELDRRKVRYAERKLG